ncbi:hypothetical protein [Rhodococcus koreensis]
MSLPFSGKVRGIVYVVAVKGTTSAHPGDAAPETAAYTDARRRRT